MEEIGGGQTEEKTAMHAHQQSKQSMTPVDGIVPHPFVFHQLTKFDSVLFTSVLRQ